MDTIIGILKVKLDEIKGLRDDALKRLRRI